MNAPVTLDPIRTLMGAMPDDEHEWRSRLYSCRNVASYRVTRTGSPSARTLLWLVVDFANFYVLAPADVEVLADVGKLCRRLMICADQAEGLEDGDGTA